MDRTERMKRAIERHGEEAVRAEFAKNAPARTEFEACALFEQTMARLETTPKGAE